MNQRLLDPTREIQFSADSSQFRTFGVHKAKEETVSQETGRLHTTASNKIL